MGSMITGEVITAAEAFERVGLKIRPHWAEDTYIHWTGYPTLFDCGHTATYGFGPLDDPDNNDARGSGRRYQEEVRIGQFWCSGAVLMSWSLVDSRHKWVARNAVVVSVDETPDGKRPCLKAHITA